jgi:hypothetical protein
VLARGGGGTGGVAGPPGPPVHDAPAPAPTAGPVSSGDDGATVNDAGRENEDEKKKRAERAGDLQGVVLHDVMDAEADRVFAAELDVRRDRVLRSYDAAETSVAPVDDR